MLTFLSLFAGIGGMDLGLERAGMRCVGQVEIDPYCRRVLAKHWPDVPRFDDVRTFTGKELSERPDLVAGGFPCQDISNAGKRAGIDGERSGLWSEFHRIVCVLRPGYVLVENVAALLGRGLDRVLGDLAASGYDAEWDCIPAAAVGAPHIRDRLFVVGYADREHREGRGTAGQQAEARSSAGRSQADAAHAAVARLEERQSERCDVLEEQPSAERVCSAVPNAHISRREGAPRIFARKPFSLLGRDARSPWVTEPDVGRVAHGIPARVDRLRGLGNAVVPQVAEHIGRLILNAHNLSASSAGGARGGKQRDAGTVRSKS